MSAPIKTLVGALIAAAVSSSSLAAPESKNPLERPAKSAPMDSKTSKQGLPPPPADMPPGSDDLPSAPSIGGVNGKLHQASPSDRAVQHLSTMRVVATVGNRAVLRGQLGRTGNLVPNQMSQVDGQGMLGQMQQGGGLYSPQVPSGQVGVLGPAGQQQDSKGIAERSLTIVDGVNFQLADGMWLRPEVQGSYVRLYLQSAKAGKTEALVYASGVEIASTMASPLPDRSEEKKSTEQATAK